MVFVSTLIVAGGNGKGRIAGKFPVVSNTKVNRIILQQMANRVAQEKQARQHVHSKKQL